VAVISDFRRDSIVLFVLVLLSMDVMLALPCLIRMLFPCWWAIVRGLEKDGDGLGGIAVGWGNISLVMLVMSIIQVELLCGHAHIL
jgi:hypothetical protein